MALVIRTGRRETSALKVLLAALDSEAARGSDPAAVFAADIRRNGEPAIERVLGRCATVVRQAKVWLSITAVIAAAAAYDFATTGNDWHALPHEHVRARQAPSPEQLLARALERQEQAFKRIQDRANARALAHVRSGQ